MNNVQDLSRIIESLKTIIQNTKDINSLYSITSDKREILRNDTTTLTKIASELKQLAIDLGAPKLRTIAENIEILIEDRKEIDDKEYVSRTDHLTTMDNHAANLENGYSDRSQQEANYTLLEGIIDEIELVKEDLLKDDKKIAEIEEKIKKVEEKEKKLRIIHEIKLELPQRLQESIDKELVTAGLVPMTDELTYVPTITELRKMNTERWKNGSAEIKKECIKIETIFKTVIKRINEIEEINKELNPNDTIESLQAEIEEINRQRKEREEEIKKQKTTKEKEQEILKAMKDLPTDLRVFFAQKLSENGLFTEEVDKFLSEDIDDSYEIAGYKSIKDYTNRNEQITDSLAETEIELEKYQKLYEDAVVEKTQLLPKSDVTKFSDVKEYSEAIKTCRSKIESLKAEQVKVGRVIRAYNKTNKLINNIIGTEERALDEELLSLGSETTTLPIEETPIIEETKTVAEETPIIEETKTAAEETPTIEETKTAAEETPIIEETRIPTMEETTKEAYERLLNLVKESKEKIQSTSPKEKTDEAEGISVAKMLTEKLDGDKKEPTAKEEKAGEAEGISVAKMLTEKLDGDKKEPTAEENAEEEKKSEKLEVIPVPERTFKKYGRESQRKRVIEKRKARKEKIKEFVKTAKGKIALGLLLLGTLGAGAFGIYKLKSHQPEYDNADATAASADTEENNPELETEIDEMMKDWDEYITESEQEEKDNAKATEDEKEDKKTDEEKTEEAVKELEESYTRASYNLGENVITTGNTIYDNMYDMEKGKNDLHPYFSNDVERTITGIVYQDLDGEIHIAKTEKEAKILEETGAILIGYRTDDNITYEVEGYYPFENVAKRR